jgi:putative ABC transport system permease protein
MRTVSLRNLAAHKIRLVLTVISVLLGTAFVAGSFVFTDTLKHSFDAIFINADKGAATVVQSRHSYNPGVPTSLASQVRAVPGVNVVESDVSGPIVMINNHGDKVDTGGAPAYGSNWTGPGNSVGEVPTFVSGHAPRGPGQVVINTGGAKEGKLATGDPAKIVLQNSQVVNVTVVGVYKTPTQTGGYLGVMFSPQQAMQLFSDGQHVNSLRISAKPGVSEQQLTARVSKLLPPTLKAETGTQARADDTNAVASALSFVNYLLLAFALIAVVVGTFIIYNTFSMIVAQRLRELALLRAIGANRSQVRRSVVFEAVVIGLIGSAIGLAGGVGLAYGLHTLLDAMNAGLPSGGLVLAPRTIVVTLVLGVLVTVLSAYAPARRAARIAPVAAMREEFATTSAANLRRRTVLGSVLVVGGGVATAGGMAATSAGTAGSLIGLGLVGVAAGAMLLSPLLARWIIAPLGRLVGRPFGPVGQLARTNAIRNPRRTAATAFALTLGLLLVSGIAVIGASMKSSVNRVFDNNVTADYILSTNASVGVPLQAAAAATRVPGVSSVTELHPVLALVNGSSDDGLGVDGPLAPVLQLDVIHGADEPGGTTMLISQQAATKHGWHVGSQVTLSIPGAASRHETVRGVYKNNPLLGDWLVSGDVYRALTPRQDWTDIVALVKAAPGTNLSTLRAGLDQATKDYYVVTVKNRTEYEGQIAQQINGLLGLLYGLLGLAIVISILGIVNTLALSVVERRREIGMLRAVGMQRKQVRRTIYLESLLIAVFGAVLGLGLGLGYGAMFTKTLHSQGLTALNVPWGQALVFLVVAGVVGVLAALWPGIRAARTKPLDAIVEA